MTNAEAIAEAKRIDESIEARIAAGEIPPRPEGYDRDAHSTWFTKYLACAAPTHRYFVRERRHVLCRECLTYAVHSPPTVVHDEHGYAVQQTVILNRPIEFVTLDCSLTPAKQTRTPRKLR